MLDDQLVQQRERLIDLLSFARRHVPYYRQVIPANVEELVSDGQRWQQLPTLTKRQIQADAPSFLSDPRAADDPAVDMVYTSGSTGTPLLIARPKLELRAQSKRLWAARAQWHPHVMRWKLLNLFYRVESSNQEQLQLWDRTVHPHYFDLSFAKIASYMDAIDDYGPDWMYSCPSTAYRLAECYRRAQRSIPTLKFIETTGEALYPYQRDFIERVFDCPVANHYGSQEFWVLSYECPAHSMHAWSDDLLLEVVRDGQPVPPGESGELVVTSLTNRVMPLIRYRQGDLVQMTPSNCPCGDPRPVLTPVGGRLETFIVTREKTVSTTIFKPVFHQFILRHEQALLEFQVVQSDYDTLEVYLVPGERFEASATEELRQGINYYLPELHCQFIVCPSIANTPSGKTPTFISHVKAASVAE
jgi:phenylacetate-CoA ligase